MHEGKIIKFYRTKAQLTQEQLGQGICSDTHISKIEKGMTDYSPEVIQLLADRLGINIEDELTNLNNIRKRLHQWHDVIIKHLFEEMEDIKDELEHITLIQLSDYQALYKLLQARYFLMKNQMAKVEKIISEIQKIAPQLPPYESNLFKHVLGLYYIAKLDYPNAFKLLKMINSTDYANPEYYYHLALAYFSNNSHILAYYYAEKALNFFKQNNCFLRIIDTEILLLLQAKDENHLDFKEMIIRFENLIHSCDICKDQVRKAKVYHNLAYEHLIRNEYKPASTYYKQSMSLVDTNTIHYMISLEGYIRSCHGESLLSRDELITLTQEGLRIAAEMDEMTHTMLFNLLMFLIREQETQYYQYLYEQALPQYAKHGYVFEKNQAEKELFNYFTKTGNTDKALEIADQYINKK